MFGKLLVVLQNLVSSATILPDMKSAGFGFGWIGERIGNFFVMIWSGICNVFYWICKWLLAFVDFLQYFIQKLIGLDYWLSNNSYTMKGATSNDLLFGFLFNDTVQRVFRAMLAIFFVLLIIFTIFAIVRQEWSYITGNNFGDGKGNSKGQILRGSIKAIALVLIFPIVLSAGIIASNAILASLVKALNIDMGSTFGNTLFYTSSLNANKYRAYANDDYRHPVSDEVNFYIIQSVSSDMEKYNQLDLAKDAGKVLILGTNSYSDNYSRVASGYEEYLKIIQHCKRYTVNAIFKPILMEDKGGSNSFTGFCIGMRLSGSTSRTYFMVEAEKNGKDDTNTTEAWYYYLRNVLQVDIMSASNNIGSSSLFSTVRDNFAPIAGERCLISNMSLTGYSKGALANACTNTWSYPGIYTEYVAFNLGASSAVVRASYNEWDDEYSKIPNTNFNSLLGNIMGYESGSVKLAYNSNLISSYFDGGQLGVVQLKSEYNVMADVTDFMLKNGLELYMLNSNSSLLDWSFRDNYNADYNVGSNFIGSQNFDLPCATNEGNTRNSNGLKYQTVKPLKVSYSEDCDDEFGDYLYLASSFADSEIKGAVFIMALKINDNKFVPLVNGKTFRTSDGSSYNFKSSYYASDYRGVVIAKGTFYTDSINNRIGEPTYLTSGTSDSTEQQTSNGMYYYELKKEGFLSQYAEINGIDKKDWIIGNATVFNPSSSTNYTVTVANESTNSESKYYGKLAYKVVDENGTPSVNESVISSLMFDAYASLTHRTKTEVLPGDPNINGSETLPDGTIKYYRYTDVPIEADKWNKEFFDKVNNSSNQSIIASDVKQVKCYLDSDNNKLSFIAGDGITYYLFSINSEFYMIVEVNSKEGIIAPMSMVTTENVKETFITADKNYIDILNNLENGSLDADNNPVKINAGKVNSVYMNYNVYYDYVNGSTKISSDKSKENNKDYVILGNEVEKLTTSKGFTLTGTEYSKYLYRTSSLTITKELDSNGNPSKSETTRFSILFDDELISLTSVADDAVCIKFGTPTSPAWADAVGGNNSNVHESVFYTIYLYNYMTGAVGNPDNYKLQEYSYKDSELKDVVQPNPDNENESYRVISFKINSDFEWDANSTYIGLYDGKNYVATIYKPARTQVNLTNLGSVTTGILYNYENYSNVLTQNCYSEKEYLIEHYKTVRNNLATYCMRRDAGFNKFWHFDFVWNFLFDVRINIMFNPLTMKTVTGQTFLLKNGISFDYFFDGVYDLTDFYIPFKLNFIILIVGSALIIKVLGTALWGVIKRFYEITLYFLATPAVASTIPLDNGARFTRSIQQPLIAKVLSTYGVILGINVFFILLMPIESLSHVFTAEDIATSGSYFLKHLGFGLLPDSVKATMLNMYVYILFLLVAFTMIEALPKTITQLLGLQGAGGDILDSGKQTRAEAGKAVKSSMDMATGKSGLDMLKKGAGAVKDSAVGGVAMAIPSAISKKVKGFYKKHDKAGDESSSTEEKTTKESSGSSRAEDEGGDGSGNPPSNVEGATAENAGVGGGDGGATADVGATGGGINAEATAAEAFNQQLFEGVGQGAESEGGDKGEAGDNTAQQLISKDDLMQMILNAVKNMAAGGNLAMQAMMKETEDEEGNVLTGDDAIMANLQANDGAGMQAVQAQLGKNLALGLGGAEDGSPQNATEGLILDQAAQNDDLKAKAVLAQLQNGKNAGALANFAEQTGLSLGVQKDENGESLKDADGHVIGSGFENQDMALETIKTLMSKGGNSTIESILGSGSDFDTSLMSVAKDEAQKGNFSVSAWDLQKRVDGVAAESFKAHAVLEAQTGDKNARTADEKAIEDKMSLELMQKDKGNVLIDALANDSANKIVDANTKSALINNALSASMALNNEEIVNKKFEALNYDANQLLEFEKAGLTSKEDILLAAGKASKLGVKDLSDAAAVIEAVNAEGADDKVLEALKGDEEAVNSIMAGLGEDSQSALMKSMLRDKDGVSYLEQNGDLKGGELSSFLRNEAINEKKIGDAYNAQKDFITAGTIAERMSEAIANGNASSEVVSAISDNIAAGYNLTNERDETVARNAAAKELAKAIGLDVNDEHFDEKLSEALQDDANQMKYNEVYAQKMDEANKIKFLAGFGKVQDAQLELIRSDKGTMKDAENLYRETHEGKELKYLSESEQNAFLLENFGDNDKLLKKAKEKVNADESERSINAKVAKNLSDKDIEKAEKLYIERYNSENNVKDFDDLSKEELKKYAKKSGNANVDIEDKNQLKALKQNYLADKHNEAMEHFGSLSADEQNKFLADTVGAGLKKKEIKENKFDYTASLAAQEAEIRSKLESGQDINQMIVMNAGLDKVKASIDGLALDTENGGAEIVAQAKKDIVALNLSEGRNYDAPKDVSKMSAEEKKAYNFNLNMLQQQSRQDGNQILQNIFNNSNILNKNEIQKELDRIAQELANQAKKDGTDKYADPKDYINQAIGLYMNKHTDTKDQLLSIGASDITLAIGKEDLLNKQKEAIAGNTALSKTLEKNGLNLSTVSDDDLKALAEKDKSFATLLNKQVTKAVAPSASLTQEQQDNFFASQAIDNAKKKKKSKPKHLSDALAEYREEVEKDPKFKDAGFISKFALKNKMPEDLPHYDNWNMLTEKQIQAAKAGRGAYATMSAEQRKAEIEKLEAKKIYKGNKRPDAYYKMSAEEQANFDREQEKLKLEAIKTRDYKKIYNKSVKVEKSKNAHKQFVAANGSEFGYVKPNSRKTKHEQDLASIKGRIDTYNSMKGLRDDSKEFSDARFGQFAKAYLNDNQIANIMAAAKNKSGGDESKAAKIRQQLFEKALGTQYKVASKKVAKDNGLNKVNFLEQKNVGAHVVRYKDAKIRKAAGAGFWHPINRGRYNAAQKAEAGEKLTKKERKRAAKSNSETYKLRVQNEQATARANLDKYANLLKSGGLTKENFKKEAINMFGPAVGKLFEKKGVGGNLEGKALAIQQREVQKLLEKLAGQSDKRAKTIGKNTTLISASKDVASEYIGKNFGKAKTQTEVKLDKIRADQLSAALNKVANSKGLTYEQVKKLIPPDLLTDKIKVDGKKFSRQFKERGSTDAEKIASLQSFLQSAAMRANKKVANDNMFKTNKDKLTKLNGVMVNKNELFKKGDISPTMLKAMGAANKKLYGNIMQNYNQNQARLMAEEATRKSIAAAYNRIRNLPITRNTRKQMEALSQRMKDSDKRLDILKAELKRSESRKKQFEARYASTQKVAAKTSGTTQKVAVSSSTRATDRYKFYQRVSDGSKVVVKQDSMTAKQVDKIARDAMMSIKSNLESMAKSLNTKTYSELRTYINRIRSGLSNDFGSNLNAMKSVLDTLQGKVRRGNEAAVKNLKKTDEKIRVNEQKLKKTHDELVQKLKALNIDIDSIEVK